MFSGIPFTRFGALPTTQGVQTSQNVDTKTQDWMDRGRSRNHHHVDYVVNNNYGVVTMKWAQCTFSLQDQNKSLSS